MLRELMPIWKMIGAAAVAAAVPLLQLYLGGPP
jgi:hypothetical protein